MRSMVPCICALGKIVWQSRERVVNMRRVFTQYTDHLGAIMLMGSRRG